MVHRSERALLLAPLLFFVQGLLFAQASPAPAVPAEPAVPAVPDAASATAQRPVEPYRTDPSVLLGATLEQTIGALGVPKGVRSARGAEAWQDDVVFIYDTVELYWFQDRVWQVRTNAAYGLKTGDSRETAEAALGEPLRRYESDFVYQRPSRAWPLRLRLRFGEHGGVTDFYVYRADF